jgi:repressor LexA
MDKQQMRPLTKRQSEILALIKDNIVTTGMPPTRAEIAKILGFKSPNAAEEHLKALAKKGMIEILPGTSRGIRLTGGMDEVEEGLPLIGQVAAGEPILAQQNIENHYKVDPSLFHPRADYLLRVSGQSMKDIGIVDGDLLAVHRSTHAENGQVVVARVDNNVTVKRFKQEGKMVYLEAENDAFDTIKVDLEAEPFELEGLAVGVIRNSNWM